MEEFNDNQKENLEPRQDRAPVVETKISKSRDGRWIIHRTSITDIKPIGYYKQVLKPADE